MPDVAQGITDSLDRNGRGGMLANLDLNAFDIIDGGDATFAGDVGTATAHVGALTVTGLTTTDDIHAQDVTTTSLLVGGVAASLVGHTHVPGDITGNDEYVADTVGAMLTGNTETGITVTYQDADNTIDFELVDEYIQDIVGAMFTGNTETGITIAYDDTNGRIDATVASQTGKFISAEQSISTDSSVAHGLGAVPHNFQVVLRVNNTGDLGYAIGDEVDSSSFQNSDGSQFVQVVAWANATDVGWSMFNTTLVSMHKTTNAETTLTNARWRIICKAQLFT
jgi:hypothetical protein